MYQILGQFSTFNIEGDRSLRDEADVHFFPDQQTICTGFSASLRSGYVSFLPHYYVNSHFTIASTHTSPKPTDKSNRNLIFSISFQV